MKKPIQLILSFIFLALTFHVKAEEKAYLHAKTGIILPLEIEGLLLGEKHVYNEPGLGESVPYNGDGIVVTCPLRVNAWEEPSEDGTQNIPSGFARVSGSESRLQAVLPDAFRYPVSEPGIRHKSVAGIIK